MEDAKYQEVVKSYLRQSHCPYCGSRTIGPLDEPFIDDADQCRLTIFCDFCQKKWDELYGLITIELTDEL